MPASFAIVPNSSDPLTELLSALDARGALSTGLAAGGAWALRFGGHAGLKFNAVVRGQAWLAVDGAAPVRLQAGDCYMLTRGHAFTLASDLALPAGDAHAVFAAARGRIATCGDGGDFLALGGRMDLDRDIARLLLDALPPLVHVPAADAAAHDIAWLLRRFVREFDSDAPGSAAMAADALHMLFIELMRLQPRDAAAPAGWLAALNDPRLRGALQAMHDDPARPWTVDELAARAHLSRAKFSHRFRRLVGRPPIDYLTTWRMQLARHALQHGHRSVADVAASVGYASESAFGVAFKRTFGHSPRGGEH